MMYDCTDTYLDKSFFNLSTDTTGTSIDQEEKYVCT